MGEDISAPKLWLKAPDCIRSNCRLGDGDRVEVQLVHYPRLAEQENNECRVITVTVEQDGRVVVEHSLSEDGSNDVEHITRTNIRGWDDA